MRVVLRESETKRKTMKIYTKNRIYHVVVEMLERSIVNNIIVCPELNCSIRIIGP